MVIVICAYFNPFGAVGRERAFYEFRRELDKAGTRSLCVEQQFAGVRRVSRRGDISLSNGDVMWQKECLLQIGIDEALARGETQIVVSDADLLFTTPDAWFRIAATFESFDWFQPYETASLGYLEGDVRTKSALSFPDPVRYGTGHPGCAWAGTANFFRNVRLYPYALLGGGDVVMTHLLAICWKHGATSQRFADLSEHYCCNVLYPDLLPSLLAWAKLVGTQRFRVGHTARNHVHSINHGSFASRQYGDRYALWRHRSAAVGAPSPGVDFSVNDTGLLAWHEQPNHWKQYVVGYFKSRI